MADKKRLSKTTKKLMSELIVTPSIPVQYKTWDAITGEFSAWITIFSDGVNVFETEKTVPLSATKDLRLQHFVSNLQKYVTEKYNPTYNPATASIYDAPRISLYDYTSREKFKPQLNRNHPWYKR